jgi:3-dehydroquinate synthase
MRSVPISLGERSYVVHVGSGLIAKLGDHCRRLKLGERCVIVSDSNVGPHFADAATRSLKMSGFVPSIVTVPAGESSKSLKIAGECYDQFAMKRLERKSFVIALGGGVVGDLAGFVAATYLRGMPFVQVATTLLAQVDSSVGGKVGINLKAGKNLVGAFHQPRTVLCDLDTLSTLPDREFRSGLAEVIKYGVIRDSELFKRVEKDLDKILERDPNVLTHIVSRCCAIKAEIVAEDEFETKGLRALLNFGHTIGHALEAVSGYDEYLHGEAISIGQVAAARLSVKLSTLTEKDSIRIHDLLVRAGLPVGLRLTPKKRDNLVEAMKTDKKVSGGEVKFVLAESLGKAVAGQRVSDSEVTGILTSLAGTKAT